jgi:hypothetical protein
VLPLVGYKCASTFSKAGYTHSSCRSRLEGDVLEAGECFGFCNTKVLAVLDAEMPAVTGRIFHVPQIN